MAASCVPAEDVETWVAAKLPTTTTTTTTTTEETRLPWLKGIFFSLSLELSSAKAALPAELSSREREKKMPLNQQSNNDDHVDDDDHRAVDDHDHVDDVQVPHCQNSLSLSLSLTRQEQARALEWL
jgi:hypothetical protein